MLSGMWTLPHVYSRPLIASNAAAISCSQHPLSAMRRAVQRLSTRTKIARISYRLIEIFIF